MRCSSLVIVVLLMMEIQARLRLFYCQGECQPVLSSHCGCCNSDNKQFICESYTVCHMNYTRLGFSSEDTEKKVILCISQVKQVEIFRETHKAKETMLDTDVFTFNS